MKLARIEKDLSVPICGVGYLDTRAGQLRAAGSFDKLPYLEHLATRPARKQNDFLPLLAVQLLGHDKRARHRAALARIVKAPQVDANIRFEAARQLATAYRSGAGKSLLLAELGSQHVQTRTDAMSALFQVAGAGELGRIADLGADPNHYVVDRFVDELGARPALRPQLLSLLKQRHAKARGERRARFAYALLRLGVAGHEQGVQRFLLSRTAPASDEDLYQLAQMCHALAARGHAFAFDAALHVSSLYASSQTHTFHWYALSVFFEKTPFDRKRVDGMSQAAAERVIAAWWTANRGRLRFDGQRFR